MSNGQIAAIEAIIEESLAMLSSGAMGPVTDNARRFYLLSQAVLHFAQEIGTIKAQIATPVVSAFNTVPQPTSNAPASPVIMTAPQATQEQISNQAFTAPVEQAAAPVQIIDNPNPG